MLEIFWRIIYMVVIFLDRILARDVAFGLGYVIAVVYYLLAKKSRDVIRINLKHILGEKFREVYVLRVFENFAFYLIDFIKIKHSNKNFFKNYFKVENKEVIDKALKISPGGAIGLSMHMGNWEFAGGYFAYLGYKINAVALDHSIKYVDSFFKLQRKRLNIVEIPFKNSSNVCIRLLKNRNILALLCDRDFTNNFVTGSLFGKKYYLPKAPFLLALRAKVPLFFGITVREGYHYRAILEGPFVYKSFNLKDMNSVISNITSVMEKHIRKYFQQWFAFQKFWEIPKDVVIL